MDWFALTDEELAELDQAAKEDFIAGVEYGRNNAWLTPEQLWKEYNS